MRALSYPSPPASPHAPEAAIRSLVRWRLVFFLLAVLVPLGLHALFERQARRLDALGDHGEATTATVTGVDARGDVSYAYEVGGTRYTWSVAPGRAPARAGATFEVLYLPEDPALTRPGTERAAAAREAASNRGFTWKVVLGASWFFVANLVLVAVRLRRLRKTGLLETHDRRAYWTRLGLTGALLVVPMLTMVVAAHANDARERGESLWPVALGAALSLAVIGGTVFHLTRGGHGEVGARSARLLRWVAPVAVAVALARALAWLAGWR